jgi:hypothetical protein
MLSIHQFIHSGYSCSIYARCLAGHGVDDWPYLLKNSKIYIISYHKKSWSQESDRKDPKCLLSKAICQHAALAALTVTYSTYKDTVLPNSENWVWPKWSNGRSRTHAEFLTPVEERPPLRRKYHGYVSFGKRQR